MTKLNMHPSWLTTSTGNRSEITAFRHRPLETSPEGRGRLLVLVPSDLDYNVLTRQIWELANATCKSVHLHSLCKDGVEVPGLHRRLATLCALIQEGGVPADVKVEIGGNWVDAVKRTYQSGDLLVCFAEQRAGLFQRPLSQILQSNLDVPLYILSGLNAQDLPQSNWFCQLMAWVGSVGIIIGSFLFQVRITSLSQDWMQTTLLIFSVAVEVWLIWVWNSLVS